MVTEAQWMLKLAWILRAFETVSKRFSPMAIAAPRSIVSGSLVSGFQVDYKGSLSDKVGVLNGPFQQWYKSLDPNLRFDRS